MEERKFVCKYCSKRFPCGKSLGGHIRTHMTENSAQANGDRRSNNAGTLIKFDGGRKKKRDLGSEDGDNLIYGLRENPKKTMRFVHSNNATLQQVKFCKECGKGFPSLKALCGHMACHSEKEKGNNYKFENQKLVMDSQSDTETNSAAPRRSKRMRFKTPSITNHPSSSVPLVNGSPSVSEVEQEQEEGARCLMLLSKDSGYKGTRFALVTESSDNNSVVLEAKSPSVDTKIAMNNGKNSVSMSNNAYELVEKKKKLHKDHMKLKSAEIEDSDNSDSGYFRYGPKKVDSDVSNDGFFTNDEFEKGEMGNMPGFEDYDVESRKMMNRSRSRNIENKKLMLEDLDNDHRTNEATKKFDSSRNTARENGSYDSTYESDENSTDTDSYPAPKNHKMKAFNGKKCSKAKRKKLKSKKSREHECPICYKIFRSGQALGGHKRSHFVGGSEENTLVIRAGAPPPAAVPCLIDLNLPAPADE